MFAKLLKHEWRATKGIIALLCVIILISGLTIGGLTHCMIKADGTGTVEILDEETASVESALPEWAEIACVLLIVAGVMAIAVCGAASVFAVIWRFYKSRFTDEGYLTYTLPVTNHQLLLSSIVNSILGVLLVMLACFAAVGIVVALILLAFPQDILWADFWMNWESIWQQLKESFVENADQFAMVGFSAIVSAVSELILLMLAVTIGALIAKKHKILAAVGVYYGISMVQSFIYSALAITAATKEDITQLLASPGAMGLIVAVISYFLMHYLTSKKLNLS